MLIVSLAAARAGVMQYSLPPWTRMHNKRGTILSVEGKGLDLARKLRIGPPQIKLCQVAPLPPTPFRFGVLRVSLQVPS